ncbi:molybdopterin molybdotransferase MoeA [Adhaeribacter aquaticus]|uniref:molybdopterin molybdotransferase MoeA n=1 Tax=Adhaeribacter aquaticus TaxID=299567 RepID=UPI0004124732|nr:molybdopterin molybdotransferase MoeA [Adhaeribacter aquaticus]
MITVEQATNLIQQNVLSLPVAEVALSEATGKVLREPIFADRDFPPFNRVAMDGIAIQYDTYKRGEDLFQIEGIQLAGAEPLTLQHADNCLEVMTGARLPFGTDTVIRYEDLKIVDRGGVKYARIQEAPKAALQNVHRQGSDRSAQDLLITEGTFLMPAEIAIAATVGKLTLKVSAPPKVAIISTGDELVDITDNPLPHQIRRSNAYMLQSALQVQNIPAQLFHLIDAKALIEHELGKLLAEFDVLLLSGGVSKGKADFVPDALTALGVKKLFHQVAQKPGKPFWFGRKEVGPVVFALPGNPVSTFVCYYQFVQPWLRECLGAKPVLKQKAILTEEVIFKPNLTYFLPVQVSVGLSGMLQAKPLPNGGSGDLAALLEADGFLELPQQASVFSAGQVFSLLYFRS